MTTDFSIKRASFEINEQPLHYSICSDAVEDIFQQKPLVVIHGFSVGYLLWEKFQMELNYPTICIDLPGCGHHPETADYYSNSNFTGSEIYVADVLNQLFLHFFPNKEPFYLLGHSMGGGIAAYWYSKKNLSLNVQKIVLCAPAGFGIAQNILQRILRLPLIGGLLMGLFGRGGLRDFANSVDIPEVSRAMLQFYEQMFELENFSMKALSRYYRNFRWFDLQEEAQSLGDLPTLLIWGTDDLVVPFEHSDEWVQKTESKIHVIENGYHEMQLAHTAEVASAVIEFIKSVE
ncbi:hypothetical protein PCE1_002439 [Barthelona sp. PCE]